MTASRKPDAEGGRPKDDRPAPPAGAQGENWLAAPQEDELRERAADRARSVVEPEPRTPKKSKSQTD